MEGMQDRTGQITRILREAEAGEGELLPLVYDELRALAERHMRGERSGHTLQATALVHEAWLRLAGTEEVSWRDRRHFYGAAAEAMRRILVDHARRAAAEKRGGDRRRVTLGAPEAPVELSPDELLGLDDALDRLASEDPRAAEVARLRFLSGLTAAEAALALGISERSVHREWTYARARLLDLLAP